MAAAFTLGVFSSQLQAQETATNAQPPAPTGDKSVGSTLQSRLRAQQLATRKVRAAYEIARATRELAEIAVEEYAWSRYPEDLAVVDCEIKLAESDLVRSEDRFNWAKRMFEKGFVSIATKASEELSFKEAQFALEQARSKKKLLVDHTKAKTVKGLQADVEKARAEELAKQAAWEREKAKQADLERQLPQARSGVGDQHPAAAKTSSNARWFAQRKATLSAETAFHDARLKRELAELSIAEYVEGGFPRELAAADEDLRQAKATLDQMRTVLHEELDKFRRNPLAGNPRLIELALRKAEFQVEQAESRRKVLV
jgi:hypothetical protein